MKALLCVFLGLISLSALTASAGAQAIGFDKKSDIEVGAGLLVIAPDYTNSNVNKNIEGVSFWGTYNRNRLLGVDAIVHLGSVVTPQDFHENSFVVGPKFSYHRHKSSIYGDIRFGIASLRSVAPNATFQNAVTGAYFQSPYGVIAFGGGYEYRLTHRVNLRPIDVEVQKWGNFEPHTLSPLLFTFGASYVIR